jgi:hypothetical protein
MHRPCMDEATRCTCENCCGPVCDSDVCRAMPSSSPALVLVIIASVSATLAGVCVGKNERVLYCTPRHSSGPGHIT